MTLLIFLLAIFSWNTYFELTNPLFSHEANLLNTPMENKLILISACLLGAKTRYDGGDNLIRNSNLRDFLAQGRLIPICPEIAGGLPTPRLPAEIIGGGGKDVIVGSCPVRNCEGENVTEKFLLGAKHTLTLAKQLNIRAAILKDGSPSCGSTYIYDGTFSGRKIKGCGVTAALLKENSVKIYHEKNLERLLSKIAELIR